MKKKSISLLLTAALALSWVPAVSAADDPFDFPQKVANELPVPVPGQLLDNSMELPDPEGTGFLAELSGPMPAVRSDGFLAEPTAPLKTFPETGKLLEEVGEPDPDATPISNAADLQAMADGGNYVLTADIDLSGVDWTPIDVGNYSTTTTLVLDGQGHTISGLTVSGTVLDVGLFGEVWAQMTVRNLILKDFSVPAPGNHYYIGALMGELAGNMINAPSSLTVENVVVDNFQLGGTVPTRDRISSIGGLAGNISSIDDLTIRACAVTGSLNCNTQGAAFTPGSVGGLAGSIQGANIALTDCITDFDVDLTGYTGPYATTIVAGLADDLRSEESVTLLRCAASGDITSETALTNTNIVGLVQGVNAPTAFAMTDCVFDGALPTALSGLVDSINSPDTVIRNCRFASDLPNLLRQTDFRGAFGGIVGGWSSNVTITNCSLEHCLNTTDISCFDPSVYPYYDFYMGGLVGIAPPGLTLTGCLNTGDIAVLSDETHCIAGSMVAAVLDSGTVSFTRCENRGSLSAPGHVGGLLSDVSANNTEVSLSFTDCRNTGSITTYNNSNGGYVGGLLGYTNGSCEMVNCVNTGDLDGHMCGGLIGSSFGSNPISFTSCRSTAKLSSTNTNSAGDAGGIVGRTDSPALTMTDCTAKVTITGNLNYSGGLLGSSVGGGGTLLRCTAIADISADYGWSALYRGGLVGYQDSSVPLVFQDCYAILSTRNDTVRESVLAVYNGEGGLIGGGGMVSADNCAAEVDLNAVYGRERYYYGGLVGGVKSGATLTRCYATGSIQADSATLQSNFCYTGGLLGGPLPNSSPSNSFGQCYGGVDITGGTYMGGLAGTGGTMYSSWSDADLRGSGSYVGGLAGQSSTGAIQDCAFLGTLPSSGYQYAGGLVGNSSANLIYNCYSQGRVFGEEYAGGLVGSQSSGTFRSCQFDGSVSGNGRSGGIVGSGGPTMYDCHTTGSVAGAYAGGIGGDISSDLYNCTSSATVAPCVTCDTSAYYHTHYLGGLAGDASGVMSNCHAKTRQSFSGSGATYEYIGGLAGEFSGTMVDCTSLGIYANRTGTMKLYVGGLFGYYSSNFILENCLVTGSVFANAIGTQSPDDPDKEYLYVGGLFGGSGSSRYCAVNSCVVEGNVTAYRTFSPDDSAFSGHTSGYAYVGGLGGYCYKLTEDSCRFTGLIAAPSDYVYKEHRLLGYENLITAVVPPVELPEEEEETYTVTVKAMSIDNPTQLTNKAGATVTVNGVSVGTTDENGQVTISGKTVKSGSMVKITASLNNETEKYFDSTVFTYLADGGSTLLVLKEMQEGKIYIKSAMYQEEGSSADLLSYLTDLRILELDDNFKKVRFEVEWNDTESDMRTLYLADEEGKFVVSLNDGETDYIQFAKLFKPDTDVYVIAEAYYKNEDGSTTEVTAKELLSIRVEPLRPHIPVGKVETDVSSGSGEENDGPYFLQGLNWAMGFDDLGPYAGEISLKNGYLNIDFSFGADLDYDILPMWKHGSMDGQVTLAAIGSLAIPYQDTYTGEWSGSVGVGINDLPDVDITEGSSVKYGYNNEVKGVFNVKYPFTVKIPVAPYVVPCFFDAILDVGGEATVGISGPYDKVTAVSDDFVIAGYGSIFAGVGAEVEDSVALKFGGQGEICPKAELFLSTDESKDYAQWDISGQLSARALIKFFEHQMDAKLQLGTYHWDGEKTTWTLFGNELGDGYGGEGAGGGGGGGGHIGQQSVQILDDTSDWQPLSRSYLANGGGFAAHDISTFAFSSTGGNLRYDNIGEVSEAALAVENGSLVLYFTADDGTGGTSGSVGSHTVLWRSVMQENGSWSDPVPLTTAEAGFPAAVHADGPFAVWEQSSDTTTEDATALLASTDIQVSVNGQNVHTFELDGYDYAPKVSASSDGSYALVSWLHDPSLTDETAEQGAIQLWYATYDATNGWSEPAQVKTAAAPVSAVPDRSSGSYICYRTADGSLYRHSPSSSSNSPTFSGLSGRTAVCNGMTASFAEDGTLTIRSSYGTLTRSTNYVQGQDVAMVYSGSSYYLFWPEAEGIRMMKGTSSNIWSEPHLLAATGELPEQLSAAVVGSVPYVSWYQRSVQEDGTHKMDLYTACADPNGVDLVLQRVRFDRDELLETGKLTLIGDVYNAGLAAANSITVTIADENAESNPIYTHTFSKSVASGATARFNATIAPSTTATTYTVTVTPHVTDTDAADNTLELAFDDMSARIMDASFLEDGGNGVQLQAMVRNDGLLPLADLKVEVRDPSGTVLKTTSHGSMETIPIGSYRQVVLADAQPHTYYTVTVSSGEAVLDSTMLYYADPDAVSLAATQLEVNASGEATLRLSGKNHEEASKQLLLALYQGDQMAACGLADVSSLNGKQTASFQLGSPLKAGSYSYKLFFLSDDGALTPYTAAKSGTVQVSE